MRKIVSYIALGLVLFVFIYLFITTGSFVTAITFAGIFFAWFLIENLFEFILPFGRKSDDKIHGDTYKKDKKELHKKTENNPTLR
jgi:hypothetical protein